MRLYCRPLARSSNFIVCRADLYIRDEDRDPLDKKERDEPMAHPFVWLNYSKLCLLPHVHHMHIGSETRVVGQVVTFVIGIFVDHNAVTVPEPAIAVANFCRSNAKEKAIESEAAWAAAGKPPNVAGAETARKMAVHPRLIEMKTDVVAACVVANPLFAIDVRSIGMAFLISVVTLWVNRLGCSLVRLGAPRRGCLMRFEFRGSATPFLVVLSKRGNGDHKQGEQSSLRNAHKSS